MSRTVPTEAAGRARWAFYVGYLAVLLLCFTPFKVIAYALPLGLTAWMVIAAPEAVSLPRVARVLVGVGVGAVFYSQLAPEFLIENYVIACITYSAFLPLYVIDTKPLASRDLLLRVLRVTATMIVIQGVVGIIQAVNGAMQAGGSFGGANGDRVAGTIYPYLEPELAFSNPMFAVNISLMLMATFFVPAIPRHERRVYLVIGAIALVLASVLHVLLMLIAAVVIATWLTRTRTQVRKRPRASWQALAVTMGLVTAVAYVALTDNVDAILTIGETAIDLDAVDIPRAVLLTRVATDLPEDAPLQPFIGLGPGQFSSRASLMASGYYLGGPETPRGLPLLDPQFTRLAYDYCLALMVAWTNAKLVVGSTQQPFFSVLSIYTELGFAGLALVGVAFLRIIRRVQRQVKAKPELRFQGLLIAAGVIFTGLLGLQENYWEAPQAILVGILLLKLLYANFAYEEPS